MLTHAARAKGPGQGKYGNTWYVHYVVSYNRCTMCWFHLTRCLPTLRARLWPRAARAKGPGQGNVLTYILWLGFICQTLPGLPRAARPSGRFAEGKTPHLLARRCLARCREAAAPRAKRLLPPHRGGNNIIFNDILILNVKMGRNVRQPIT